MSAKRCERCNINYPSADQGPCGQCGRALSDSQSVVPALCQYGQPFARCPNPAAGEELCAEHVHLKREQRTGEKCPMCGDAVAPNHWLTCNGSYSSLRPGPAAMGYTTGGVTGTGFVGSFRTTSAGSLVGSVVDVIYGRTADGAPVPTPKPVTGYTRPAADPAPGSIGDLRRDLDAQGDWLVDYEQHLVNFRDRLVALEGGTVPTIAERVAAGAAARGKCGMIPNPIRGSTGDGHRISELEREVTTLRLASQEWKALAEKVAELARHVDANGVRGGIPLVWYHVDRLSDRLSALEPKPAPSMPEAVEHLTASAAKFYASAFAPACPCGAPSLTVSRQWGPLCRACANKRVGYDVTPERGWVGGEFDVVASPPSAGRTVTLPDVDGAVSVVGESWLSDLRRAVNRPWVAAATWALAGACWAPVLPDLLAALGVLP